MSAAVAPLYKDEQPASEQQRTLSGSFEVAVMLTDKRNIKMTGYVYSDDDRASINQRVDLYQSTLDRQVIKCDILAKKAEITMWTANLEAQKSAYEGLAAKKAKGPLSSQEKQAVSNFEPNVKQCNDRIASCRAAIAAAEEELAKM